MFIFGKDISCKLFITLTFHWTQKQQHISFVTLFTTDVKGSFAELFSISAKRGHSQNIALIDCIMWTSTLTPQTHLSSSIEVNGSALGWLQITKALPWFSVSEPCCQVSLSVLNTVIMGGVETDMIVLYLLAAWKYCAWTLSNDLRSVWRADKRVLVDPWSGFKEAIWSVDEAASFRDLKMIS